VHSAVYHCYGILASTSQLRSARLNEALELVGLVPEGIDHEDTQIQRVLHRLGQNPTDLEKYIYLSQLQDTDETLFIGFLCPIPHISFRWCTHERSARSVCSSDTLFAAQGSTHFNEAERTYKGSTP
jgi:hypothetical protein